MAVEISPAAAARSPVISTNQRLDRQPPVVNQRSRRLGYNRFRSALLERVPAPWKIGGLRRLGSALCYGHFFALSSCSSHWPCRQGRVLPPSIPIRSGTAKRPPTRNRSIS